MFLIYIPLNAEPSAFELQSGATKKELSTIKSTNKTLESVVTDLQNRVSSLEQIQDGLKSLFEGQSLKIKNLLDSVANHQNSIKSLESVQELHSNTLKQQADLIQALKTEVDNNQKSIKELDKKLNDLSNLLTQINTTMISQLNTIRQNLEIQTPSPDTNKDLNKQSNPKVSKSSQYINPNNFKKDVSKQKEIFQEARKMIPQNKLQEAKARFEWMVESNYRPAHSLYFLGEIAYKQKDYKEAISFYKKSALLNDKANYMPILLWHTAWAFRYSKDLSNYHKFLDSLIYLYPNSEQGQKAIEIKNRTKGKK
ncbi:hypothetical protein BKH44_00635 [Helicobacter sp. 13S00477-4]|nr:hypothetical protein BKH44_00635 [Helicobacter sp. 13S00477-4]